MKITEPTPSHVLRSVRTEAPQRSRAASRLDTGPTRFEQVLSAEAATVQPAATRVAPPAAPVATAAAPVSTTPVSTTNVFALVTPFVPAPPAAAAPVTAAEQRPTAESVFGANPWMASAGGFSEGGGAYSYNTMYFATRETAEKVAQMLGGKVVAKNAMVGDAGPFVQQQPNYMVELPNGHLVNAGLTASYFTHGWSQSFIDTMLGYDRNV